jgi:hypothetical protein
MIKEATEYVKVLKKFVSPAQLNVWASGIRTEERKFFFEKMEEFVERFNTMHKTYEQDGKGDDAIVHLHYFRGGMDWYITERDMEDEQHQAFGLCCIDIAEMGYVSIEELKSIGAELDMYWTPKKLGIVRKVKG